MSLISLNFVDNSMTENCLVKIKLLVLLLLDRENDMFMNERKELDEIFFNQMPVLKHNLPVEILGDPPPPKGDPVFELKQFFFYHSIENLLRINEIFNIILEGNMP